MEQRRHSRNSKNRGLDQDGSREGIARGQVWQEGGSMEGTVGNGAREGAVVWRPSGAAGGPWVKADLRRTGVQTELFLALALRAHFSHPPPSLPTIPGCINHQQHLTCLEGLSHLPG